MTHLCNVVGNQCTTLCKSAKVLPHGVCGLTIQPFCPISQISLTLKDIMTVSKEKTARWIPNAIQINMNTEKVCSVQKKNWDRVKKKKKALVGTLTIFTYLYLIPILFFLFSVLLHFLFCKREKLPDHFSHVAKHTVEQGKTHTHTSRFVTFALHGKTYLIWPEYIYLDTVCPIVWGHLCCSTFTHGYNRRLDFISGNNKLRYCV